MNTQHKAGIEGQADLPRAGRPPRIGQRESGGIQMSHWKTLLTIGVAVGLVVVLAGCQQGEKAAGNVRTGPAGSGAVRVLMEDNTFQPQVLKVPAGSPVTVEVRNHGDVKTVTFTAPKGATEFSCTWHRGMVGRIVAT